MHRHSLQIGNLATVGLGQPQHHRHLPVLFKPAIQFDAVERIAHLRPHLLGPQTRSLPFFTQIDIHNGSLGMQIIGHLVDPIHARQRQRRLLAHPL